MSNLTQKRAIAFESYRRAFCFKPFFIALRWGQMRGVCRRGAKVNDWGETGGFKAAVLRLVGPWDLPRKFAFWVERAEIWAKIARREARRMTSNRVVWFLFVSRFHLGFFSLENGFPTFISNGVGWCMCMYILLPLFPRI